MTDQVATFGAGCFWGVEKRFRQLPGVQDVTVGYMGGTLENPTYRDVCSGRTGHAEVAQVRFDDSQLGFGELLDLFFAIHNPTTLNRQGPDIGTQYRSAIFTHGPEQETAARASKDAAQGTFAPRPIVTEIVPAGPFTKAEDYHQQYFEKRGRRAFGWL